MRVRFGGTWIADSEQVVLLFEPGRYPVVYFPETAGLLDLQMTEPTFERTFAEKNAIRLTSAFGTNPTFEDVYSLVCYFLSAEKQMFIPHL
jgi:hypothetical protein